MRILVGSSDHYKSDTGSFFKLAALRKSLNRVK